jgi:hypothetical protein
MIPSPQVTAHVLGVPEQVKPGSTAQVLEQPSLLRRFPSSHGSLPTRRPSPQFGTQTLGCPGGGS